MRVNEVIAIVDAMKANELSEEVKIAKLNDVEGRVFCEIGKGTPKDFCAVISSSDELSVPAPYSKMYVLYLLALIAFQGKEYEMYEKMLLEYEQSFLDYAKYCVRNR